MMRRKVTTRDKQIRRLNYTCPRCKSDKVRTNDRECTKIYSCMKDKGCAVLDVHTICKGCNDFVSDNRVNLRLKCLDCLYEWTVLSRL